MSRVEATFYGDTEDEARVQLEDWRASESKVDLRVIEFSQDEQRVWTWHAVISMTDREQMSLAL